MESSAAGRPAMTPSVRSDVTNKACTCLLGCKLDREGQLQGTVQNALGKAISCLANARGKLERYGSKSYLSIDNSAGVRTFGNTGCQRYAQKCHHQDSTLQLGRDNQASGQAIAMYYCHQNAHFPNLDVCGWPIGI